MQYGLAVGALLLSLSVEAAPAHAGMIEVEFSEVDLPNLTLLDGTDFFDAFGLSFEDLTYYAIDSDFIGAGLDNIGITTSGFNNLLTVVFTPEVTSVTIDFVTISFSTMFGAAFDSEGAELDSFFFDPGGVDPAYGSHTFSDIGNIAKVTFSDGNGFIGVGRLRYTFVPAPASLALLALGAVAGIRRRRN